MKNLIFTLSVLFFSVSIRANSIESTAIVSPAKTDIQTTDLDISSVREDLLGTWETDAGRNTANSSLSLELTFTENTIEVQTRCEYFGRDYDVDLTATATSPVRYRAEGFHITQSNRSRVDQGRFFCEAVATVSYHRARVIDQDRIDLINPDTGKRIRLYRK